MDGFNAGFAATTAFIAERVQLVSRNGPGASLALVPDSTTRRHLYGRDPKRETLRGHTLVSVCRWSFGGVGESETVKREQVSLRQQLSRRRRKTLVSSPVSLFCTYNTSGIRPLKCSLLRSVFALLYLFKVKIPASSCHTNGNNPRRSLRSTKE